MRKPKTASAFRILSDGRTPRASETASQSVDAIRQTWLRRYADSSDQIEAEGEFTERRIKCRLYLESLSREMTEGGVNGFRELLFLAHDATEIINNFAEAAPDLAAVFAENYNAWPILWMGGNINRKRMKWLEKLRLGAAKPDLVNLPSLRKEITLTQKWAILLLNLLTSARWVLGIRRPEQGEPWFWGLRRVPTEFRIPVPNQLERDKWRLKGVGDPEYCQPQSINVIALLRTNSEFAKMAEGLPPFNYETAEDWWHVAEKAFSIITDAGLDHFPGLSALARTEKVGTLKKSTGTQYSELVKYIQPVFRKLARC